MVTRNITAARILAVLVFSVTTVYCRAPYSFKNADEAAKWGTEIQELRRSYEKGDPQVEAQLAEMYKMWTGKFGKDRSSKERAAGNEGAFIANLWKAGEINLKSPNTGWWASMNAFADMDFATFTRYRLQVINQSRLRPTKNFLKLKFRLTSFHNWKTSGKVTPVKNQFGCGSCWAFAAVGALESRYLIKKAKTTSTYNIDLSEQRLVDCVRSPRTSTSGTSYNSGGCAGGWSDEAMNYALKFNVTTETLYPYQGINGACRQRVLTATGSQTVFKQRSPVAVGFTQVTTNNVTAIKQAIRYSPTAFYFRVESPFQLYNGGIFSTPCTGTSVNHAMLMYGYVQPLTGSGYWRIKNSWGVNWGEGGTMRLQIPLTASSTSAGICRAHSWHYLPNDDNVFPV